MEIIDPSFDYDIGGHDYSELRKADPRIAVYIAAGLRGMQTVINLGAGTGSYEPRDVYVIAVEPSRSMRAKRLETGRTPALGARAEALPFDDASFDASLAILTIHHWVNLPKGLAEMKRVTKKKIVILTYDPSRLELFWNAAYFPELVAVERTRYPEISTIKAILGLPARITNIRIPFDCTDGFQEAYYGRPEEFLKEKVRRAQSAWSFIGKEREARYVATLAGELDTGEWDRKYGFHRTMPEFEGAYRMLEFELTPG